MKIAREKPFSWRPTRDFFKLAQRLGLIDMNNEDIHHGAKSQTIDKAVEIANARLDELESRAAGLSNTEIIILLKMRGLKKGKTSK